jgi:hypothetical protein
MSKHPMDRTSDDWKAFVANVSAKGPEGQSRAERNAIRYEMLLDELARGSTTVEWASEINCILNEIDDAFKASGHGFVIGIGTGHKPKKD